MRARYHHTAKSKNNYERKIKLKGDCITGKIL